MNSTVGESKGPGAEKPILAADPAARHRQLEGTIRDGEPAQLAQALGQLDPTAAEDAVAYVGGSAGRSLWHAAAEAGDRRSIDVLRRFGAGAIDARDHGGRTSLHQALGWDAAATEGLAPALELLCLSRRIREKEYEVVDDMGLANTLARLKLQCEDRFLAALPPAVDYMTARVNRGSVAEVVVGLLQAGANPTLSFVAALPSFPAASLDGRTRESQGVLNILGLPPEEWLAGLLDDLRNPGIDYPPLQMAMVLAHADAVVPLFGALAACGVNLSDHVEPLLATDRAAGRLAQALPEGAPMARAFARTRRKFIIELWNRVRESPNGAQSIYYTLAERHDTPILTKLIQAVEAQAARDPARARRSVERSAQNSACLLHALLTHHLAPELIGRTLRLGASATASLRMPAFGRSVLPMDLATNLGVHPNAVHVQVLLEPRYRAWFRGAALPGASLQPTAADTILVSGALATLRQSSPDPGIIALLLDAGAPASHVCDLTIADHVGNYPSPTPGLPSAVSWPLQVSALDACAISGAREAAAVLLRHPSMEGQQQLIKTARRRAGMARDQAMQRFIATFLHQPGRRPAHGGGSGAARP